MFRLFATLYLSIVLALILLIVSLSLVPRFASATSEQQINALEADFVMLAVAVLTPRHLPAGFSIVDNAELELTQQQREILHTPAPPFGYRLLSMDDEHTENSIYYYSLGDGQRSYKIVSDMSLSIDNTRIEVSGGQFILGLFDLLERWLQDQQQAEAALQALNKKLNIPLSITDTPASSKATNITQGQRQVIFAQDIGHGQTLQIGPVLLPWQVYYLPMLVIGLIALCFAGAILLWLFPLWRKLSQLEQATQGFANGDYSIRLPFKKHSAIHRLGHSFNHMAQLLEQQIRNQQYLIAAVSHELKTPLARLRFSIHELERGRMQQLHYIQQDIDELDELTSELLDFSRYQSGQSQPQLSDLNLQDWYNSIIDSLQRRPADQCQIDTGTAPPAIVLHANEAALSRAASNLINNALRHARQRIAIQTGVEQGEAYLRIEDDGEGIEAADLEHIFEPFYRADSSRNKNTGGYGLGLAITRQIMKAHHGDVHIRQSQLGGACFELRWPVVTKSGL